MSASDIETVPDVVDAAEARSRGLERIWATAPGVAGFLSTVDHKRIGVRYMVTAFVFLILGGLEAAVMRAQLARPDQTLLTPEQYDQLFSMHGMTMIFLYAMPILSGFSNYLWPLLLGAHHRGLQPAEDQEDEGGDHV
ncbi:MAG: cbb3-type cytochrome c oxidase subunit I, partial [Caulobacterales bacterium]